MASSALAVVARARGRMGTAEKHRIDKLPIGPAALPEDRIDHGAR
jgi:hypothetical protein